MHTKACSEDRQQSTWCYRSRRASAIHRGYGADSPAVGEPLDGRLSKPWGIWGKKAPGRDWKFLIVIDRHVHGVGLGWIRSMLHPGSTTLRCLLSNFSSRLFDKWRAHLVCEKRTASQVHMDGNDPGQEKLKGSKRRCVDVPPVCCKARSKIRGWYFKVSCSRGSAAW